MRSHCTRDDTLANRLAARLPLPEYTAERHAAWLTGRAQP